MPLTHRQRAVWAHLEAHCQGRAYGRRHEDLVRELAIPHRRLREALQALVLEHHKPIGSHPRWGVYVCRDATDYALARQCLTQESLPGLKRRTALERMEKHLRAREAQGVQMGLFEGVGA